MMTETAAECSCVIDTSGLHQLATASGNLKAILIVALQEGIIGVPSWAWREFNDLYKEEAVELVQHIVKRIHFSEHVHVRAARISEELGLGFSLGPYDGHIELYTAAVAINKNYTVLTSNDNVTAYHGMNCTVKELADWANENE